MLTTELKMNVEDLRLLHQMYYCSMLFAKYYDKIVINDDRARMSFQPSSEEELHRMDVLRHRAFNAMDKTFSDLPSDHPDVIENKDVAELWTPYPHEIPFIQELISDWEG